jgi:hypothetical protein
MNCKPPCLAYIASCDYPQNIGMPVEVINECLNDDHLGFCWLVKASRPVPCYNRELRTDVDSSEFFMPDADLRPISGLPIDEEVTDEVTA